MKARPFKRPASWAGPYAWSAGGQEKQQRRREGKEEAKASETKDLTDKGQKIRDELDHLIEEIDEVLEENAEEFVRNYVQRGGQ
jgi:ubiquitin-like protein Pup